MWRQVRSVSTSGWSVSCIHRDSYQLSCVGDTLRRHLSSTVLSLDPSTSVQGCTSTAGGGNVVSFVTSVNCDLFVICLWLSYFVLMWRGSTGWNIKNKRVAIYIVSLSRTPWNYTTPPEGYISLSPTPWIYSTLHSTTLHYKLLHIPVPDALDLHYITLLIEM